MMIMMIMIMMMFVSMSFTAIIIPLVMSLTEFWDEDSTYTKGLKMAVAGSTAGMVAGYFHLLLTA